MWYSLVKLADHLTKLADFGSGNWRVPSFDSSFMRLPIEVQKAARMNYSKMLENPQAVSLKMMPGASSKLPIYSARIGNYRSLAVKAGRHFIWYWIGSHEEYNNVKSQTPPKSAIELAKNISNKGS